MPEREKVIKGLECCNNDECDNCSYYRSCDENDLGTCRATLHRDALVLLKAQEPVKPLPGLWDRDIPLFSCGGCGGEIGAKGISKYCSRCGRAVKWE